MIPAMTPAEFPALHSSRFQTQRGVLVTVQTPEICAQSLVDAVLAAAPLSYGDYDQVAYRSASGEQQFRSLGTGRNAATREAVSVNCCEVRFFLAQDSDSLEAVMTALYDAHPYEEPVILVTPCLRGLHIRGQDEDNPNRFWNQRKDSEACDWVPLEHR